MWNNPSDYSTWGGLCALKFHINGVNNFARGLAYSPAISTTLGICPVISKKRVSAS